jgi:polyhydroxybutyrate depolymerase
MQTKLFLLILLLFSSYEIYPQNSWFEGNNLNSVASVDANNIVAVGGGLIQIDKFGIILRSTDGGNNWAIESTTDVALYGVSFSDINNGTAVGNAGTVLRTKDGGENWVIQPLATGYSLSAVSFTDSTTGTAVGFYGTIHRTTDAGNTWLNQTSGTTNWLYGVSFKDVNHGWAVGASGTILYTTNGGSNWIQQTSGTNQTLYGVSFTNLIDGVIVGASGTILQTTDAGNTWISQVSGTTNHLYGISFVDNNWAAVGGWGTIIRNGIIQESETTNRLNGVGLADANNVNVVGLFGTVLNTSDGGSTWINKLWTQVSSYNFVYNGHNRSYYVFKPYNYSSLGSLPLMFALCGSNQNGQIFQDLSLMSSVADTSGFIAVYPTPYDGFWNIQTEVGFISALIDSVNSNYNVDLSRVYTSGFSSGGFMSHQLGCKLPNRIAAIAPVAGIIESSTISGCVATASPPVFYMHGTLDNIVPYSGVEETLNFWIDRNAANVSVDSIALPDIDTTDGSTVMKYLFRNSSGVARVAFYKIINGGHIYPGITTYENPIGNENMNRDISASQEIWNFVKDFDITVGISENSQFIPNNFNLFQNYPNPFNPVTTIRFEVPNSSFINIKVYDVLGNEIATLVNEEKSIGNYEVQFDATKLTSGIYFYKLQAGSFIETKKMVLMK